MGSMDALPNALGAWCVLNQLRDRALDPLTWQDDVGSVGVHIEPQAGGDNAVANCGRND